jgi:hypothetical protein
MIDAPGAFLIALMLAFPAFLLLKGLWIVAALILAF